MVVQSTYTEQIEAGRPGLMVGSDFNADTGIVETVAGIGFGIAVSQGSADKGIIIGGTTAGFRGVTIRDVSLDPGDSDTYKRYKNAGVLTRGKIWVKPNAAYVAGDPVYFVAATGVISPTSGGNQAITGARFVTSGAQDALGIIELSGYNA